MPFISYIWRAANHGLPIVGYQSAHCPLPHWLPVTLPGGIQLMNWRLAIESSKIQYSMSSLVADGFSGVLISGSYDHTSRMCTKSVGFPLEIRLDVWVLRVLCSNLLETAPYCSKHPSAAWPSRASLISSRSSVLALLALFSSCYFSDGFLSSFLRFSTWSFTVLVEGLVLTGLLVSLLSSWTSVRHTFWCWGVFTFLVGRVLDVAAF